MTRTERPAWLDDADPMTPPTDTQMAALRQLDPGKVFAISGGWTARLIRCTHQSWVHHSTRDALLRRGYITIDQSGYVTLTDTGRQAVR